MSAFSPFSLTPQEASQLAKESTRGDTDNRKCFFLTLRLETVYGSSPIPHGVYKKLPRIINGIPLGAGKLNHINASDILWKYVQGGSEMHMFISRPTTLEAAEETKVLLRNRLVRQSKEIFGDITVKASITLSLCLAYDSEIFINDIAEPMCEGLHFIDWRNFNSQFDNWQGVYEQVAQLMKRIETRVKVMESSIQVFFVNWYFIQFVEYPLSFCIPRPVLLFT